MENKKLKDENLLQCMFYYFGCEVQFHTDTKYQCRFIGFDKGRFQLKSDNDNGILLASYHHVKLKLDSIQSAIKKGIIASKNKAKATNNNIVCTPNDFRMLIESEVDLFGLIEAGLAVQK